MELFIGALKHVVVVDGVELAAFRELGEARQYEEMVEKTGTQPELIKIMTAKDFKEQFVEEPLLKKDEEFEKVADAISALENCLEIMGDLGFTPQTEIATQGDELLSNLYRLTEIAAEDMEMFKLKSVLLVLVRRQYGAKNIGYAANKQSWDECFTIFEGKLFLWFNDLTGTTKAESIKLTGGDYSGTTKSAS